MYDVTISATEGGIVSPQSGSFEEGSSVTFTATPNAEYEFTKWSNGSTQNPLVLTVISDLSIQATFTKKQYELIITKEGDGTVNEKVINTGKGYDSGTKIELTAVPAGEWVFAGWSGDVTSTDNPLQVTISSPKNIKAKFVKRKYPLTINIEGQGTVTEEIVNTGRTTEYDSGTTVRLTAQASEGWEFVGWTGNIISNVNPVQLNISSSKSLIANFNKINILINESYNEIPLNGKSWERIYQTLYNSQANIVYEVGSNRYLLFPGNGYDDGLNEKSYPILFKEVDGKWKFLKSFIDVEMEDVRNYRQINSSTYLWAGAAENYNCSDCSISRPSNLWVVKVITDDVIFTKVNVENGWFHDASFGDLDNDGLIDIVWNSRDVYFQNSDGTFRIERNVFPDTFGTVYLSFEIGNIIGDSRPEVVAAVYLNPEYEHQRNGYIIYQFNDETRKMDAVFKTTNPYELITSGDFGANYTRIVDINNDGYNDLIIGREGTNSIHNGLVEIWLGNGTSNLIPLQLIHDNKEFNILGFELLDVNRDGYLDIVFKSRNGSVRLGQTFEDGFRLNDLIWINKGNGEFEKYSKKDLVGGVGLSFGKFVPYVKNGNLTFFGEYTYESVGSDFAISYIYEVEIIDL